MEQVKIRLTSGSIRRIESWLEDVDVKSPATMQGVKAGTHSALQELGIEEDFTRCNEREVYVGMDILNKLKEDIVKNKICALWNLGYASGMYHSLVELGISEELLDIK